MSAAPRHSPVMVDEVIAQLAPRAGGFYVDGTYGGGGYSRAILAAAQCRVLGLDRDPAAVARGQDAARQSDGRLSVALAPFSEMARLARDLGETAADGVALDLGISSDQLEDPARGFSFTADGPLDMRLDPETGGKSPSAADLVNTLDERALAQILKTYGEEPEARRIARAIVKLRSEKPITRTGALAQLIEKVSGPRAKAARIHPATRSFQALRIAVNDELAELARGLAAAERLLKPAGRLAVVAFHSLEDRIVKQFLAARSGRAGTASRHRPETVDAPPSFILLHRGALKPSEAEIARNPRARSARLRAAERSAAAPHPFDLSLFVQKIGAHP
jgi:16S rRNA (cytosine1402-N4)-methyltransferase